MQRKESRCNPDTCKNRSLSILHITCLGAFDSSFSLALLFINDIQLYNECENNGVYDDRSMYCTHPKFDISNDFHLELVNKRRKMIETEADFLHFV